MPFRILVLHDGKAGHASQALGLARLIARQHDQPTEIAELAMSPRLKLLNRLLRLWAQLPCRNLLRLLPLFYRQRFASANARHRRPDLIVSFGGNVLALNVSLSRLWQTPNAVIGNTYALPSRLISANVTLQGNPATANSVASLIPLGKACPQHCQQASHILVPGDLPRWALLIGGDGSGYQYAEEDWQHLASAAKALAQRHQIRWLITTSRRTPKAAFQALQDTLDASVCDLLIDGSKPSNIPIEALLGGGERIFCSEDSMSMLAEAIAMNRPVMSLQPAHSEPRSGHARALEYLQESGLVERQQLANWTTGELAPWQPQQDYLAHSLRVYRQLARLGAVTGASTTRAPAGLTPSLGR